jgi:hypothetical protein
MQHSSDLHLESDDMTDELEDEQSTFTNTTSEQSASNDQHTPSTIQSDWSLQLQQQQAQAAQAAQQAIELLKQQLRLQIQQGHNFLVGFLHQNPGFLYGADRSLMKSLSELVAPVGFFLYENFPTPFTAPDLPGLESDGSPLIARPLNPLLDTDYIPNHVWNTSGFQIVPALDCSTHTSLDVVEQASILNNLNCTDQQIIDDYRDTFQFSMVQDQLLLQFISEGRWKAKCVLWLPGELDIIRRVVSDGLLAANTTFPTGFNGPDAQQINWSVWKALHDRWAFYPKTYDRVSAKYAEIQAELVGGS